MSKITNERLSVMIADQAQLARWTDDGEERADALEMVTALEELVRLRRPVEQNAEISAISDRCGGIGLGSTGFYGVGRMRADLGVALLALDTTARQLRERVAMLSVVQDALSERNRECVELRERIGRLQGALESIEVSALDVPERVRAYAKSALAASQHTAGSGDGVAQQPIPGIDQGQFLASCEAGNRVFGEGGAFGGTPE